MKHIVAFSLFFIFSCSSQSDKTELQKNNGSVVEIINTINAKLKTSDFSPNALKKIANEGFPLFESYIRKNQNLSDQELDTWVEMYRGLENYAFKETEKTDRFINKMINSDELGVELKSRLEKTFKSKIYFAELPENTIDTDGKPIKISDYNDKVVLIDFWATWCGPCIGELPNVKEAYNKYKSKGFDIVGISLDSDLDKLKRFTEKKDMPWRQISDGKQWSSEFARHYGINSIPATFLLKNGKIVAKNLRGKELERAIEKYL